MKNSQPPRFTTDEIREALSFAGYKLIDQYPSTMSVPFHSSQWYVAERWERCRGDYEWMYFPKPGVIYKPAVLTYLYNRTMKNLASANVELDKGIAAVLRHCT